MTMEQIGGVAAKIADAAAQKMPDDGYTFWRRALANPAEIGKTLLIHDGEPQSGYYVQRSRKEWRNGVATISQPQIVAIWKDGDGAMQAIMGAGEARKSVDPSDIWTWVAATPITHALYDRIYNGGDWPEEYLPKVSAPPEPPKEPEIAPEPMEVANRAPVYGMPVVPTSDGVTSLGDNGGPALGEEIASQVKAENALLRQLTAEPVEDKDTAEKVGECVNRLRKLKKQAEDEHKAAKEPWLEGGRAVDAAFKPAITAADDGVKLGSAKVKTFLAKEQARLEQIAREEAARKQAEIDRKAREQAELTGKSVEDIEVKQVKPKQVVAKVGAAAGRSLTVNARKWFKAEITDYDALLTAMKDEDDIRQAVAKVAHRIANTKDAVVPAGMRVVEDERSAA